MILLSFIIVTFLFDIMLTLDISVQIQYNVMSNVCHDNEQPVSFKRYAGII